MNKDSKIWYAMLFVAFVCVFCGMAAGEYIKKQKEKEIGLCLDSQVSLMDYEWRKHKLIIETNSKVREGVNPEYEEIAERSRAIVDSCFNDLFVKYGEKDVLETCKKFSKTDKLNSKEDFYQLYTNVLAEIVLNEATKTINIANIINN